MTKKNNLGKELLALGKDLADAVDKMKSSKEFKAVERDITKAVKSISNSVWASLKAARKSPSTKKIQKRLGKVLDEGKKQSAVEIEKAQTAAAKGIQRARILLKKYKRVKKSGGPQSIL